MCRKTPIKSVLQAVKIIKHLTLMHQKCFMLGPPLITNCRCSKICFSISIFDQNWKVQL